MPPVPDDIGTDCPAGHRVLESRWVDGDVASAEPASQLVTVRLGREDHVDSSRGRGRAGREGIGGERGVHERDVGIPGGRVVVVDWDVVGDAEDPYVRGRHVGRG